MVHARAILDAVGDMDWERIRHNPREVLSFRGYREKRQAQKTIRCITPKFLKQLESIDAVSQLLVGSKHNDPTVFIWSVLQEDMDFRDLDERQRDIIRKLNRCSAQFEIDLVPAIPLCMRYVNPSSVEKLKEYCEQEEIVVDEVSLVA